MSSCPIISSLVEEAYHLGEPIGTGQFGEVRLATSYLNGNSYACKSIYKPISKSKLTPVTAKRHLMVVYGEIQTMYLVSGHPNIVKCFEIFEDIWSHHFILELCTNGDLFNYISQKGSFQEQEAVEVIRQLASALHHCHSMGVVHRDVKPENVFISVWKVDSSGRKVPTLKLGDFGTATRLRFGEEVCEMAGTLNYSAPEMVLGGWTSFPVDVWSLGVVLYIMLTGKFPFSGETREAIESAICNDELTFDSPVWKRRSPECIDLVRWMLHRDPKKRATISDVLNHPWLKLNGFSICSSFNSLTLGKNDKIADEFPSTPLIRSQDSNVLQLMKDIFPTITSLLR